jgi:hypothetical protein
LTRGETRKVMVVPMPVSFPMRKRKSKLHPNA